MDELTSDSTQSEISTRVKCILRSFFVNAWQSEAYNQNKKFGEQRCQTSKRQTDTLLDRTGAPAFAWLIEMWCVCIVINHTYDATIKTCFWTLQQVLPVTCKLFLHWISGNLFSLTLKTLIFLMIVLKREKFL